MVDKRWADLINVEEKRLTFMDVSRQPLVIWPAPGLPAFLESHERQFEIVVAHGGDSTEDLQAWAGQLALRPVAEDACVRLRVVAVMPSRQGNWIAAIGLRGPAADADDVAGPHPAANPGALDPLWRRKRYALRSGPRGSGDASRAVAVWRGQSERLRLAFVSDLHMAAFWDVMAAAVDRHAPDLAMRFLNPRRLLERFVKQANRLWARGELDLIVLGGDQVESVYAGPRAGNSAAGGRSNVQMVVEALADCACRPWRFAAITTIAPIPGVPAATSCRPWGFPSRGASRC